jgi:hypothetical protein
MKNKFPINTEYYKDDYDYDNDNDNDYDSDINIDSNNKDLESEKSDGNLSKEENNGKKIFIFIILSYLINLLSYYLIILFFNFIL